MSSVPCILKINLSLEISIGMTYLHKHGILHCDLKVGNILIGDNFNAKISDFGLSMWKNLSRGKTNIGNIAGTASHVPPEKFSDINNSHRDEKWDVYSFSILLWELFTEKEAYADNTTSLIRMWVSSGKRLSLDCFPSEAPTEVCDQIESCWRQDPRKRPTFAAVKYNLESLACGTTNKKLIKEAKEKVIITLRRLSSSRVYADHVQKLKQRQSQLCEFIRRTDHILSSLRKKREITQQEYELICFQPTDYETTNLLIIKLCEKPDSAYQSFLNALRNSNQHYLVSLLEYQDYELDTDHRTILVDNTIYLKKNILLSNATILDQLLQTEVLDTHEVEKIISKDTNDEKVHQLLHYIMRTSRDQYLLFLVALNKADHEFVYNKLKGVADSSMDDESVEESGLTRNDDQIKKEMNLTSCITMPSVLHVLPSTGRGITGITVVANEVFVVRGMPQVYVYKSDDFTLIRELMISESKELRGLVSCSHYSCLYVSDWQRNFIYRYDLIHNVTSNWSVSNRCYGLSVTKCNNVLVTLCDSDRIQEFTTFGSLVREIKLDSSTIDRPRHCVPLSTDDYVVCHGLTQRHRVCIVDQSGRVKRSYGGSRGSGVGQLDTPRVLALNIHDNILISDYNNHRVALLNHTLTYLGEIVIPGHLLKGPYALHLDELNHHLYIGEGTHGGRLFLLDIKPKIIIEKPI